MHGKVLAASSLPGDFYVFYVLNFCVLFIYLFLIKESFNFINLFYVTNSGITSKAGISVDTPFLSFLLNLIANIFVYLKQKTDEKIFLLNEVMIFDKSY